jgi:glycosyltransferase involved in cell wall biosynthesis
LSTVVITYDYLSPAQVAAMHAACDEMARRGHRLVPVEFFGDLPAYGWKRGDVPRPPSWQSLYPDRSEASRHRVFADLARLVRRESADVLVVNGWYHAVAWWSIVARPVLPVKLVLVADSTDQDKRRRPVLEAAKRAFLRRVDAVFTGGTRQRRYLEALGVDPARITDGCDVVDNARFAREPGAGGESTVVGTTARLVPPKNLEAALEAFARVAADTPLPALRWTIAGAGPLEAPLRRRAEKLGAPVDLVGYVEYDRMPAFYRGLDLYWQPSLSEPWGLAVNEAMASGLPVLVSDRCGCVEDLVTPENGWIHDTDEGGLERGLRTALAHRAEWPARGDASRARIAPWGLERFARGLAAAVDVAIGAARSRGAAHARPAGGAA